MKSLPTVTIGIPAYNEEIGLKKLLAQITYQSFIHTRLVKVIVYSDGSTDSTAAVSLKFSKLPIVVIDQNSRKGKPAAQNSIIKITDTDILILLDSDIMLENNDCIDQLAYRTYKGNYDLCAPKVVPLSGESKVSKILMPSIIFKGMLYESINGGNNIYTCHGRARAFSKKLYSRIKFKDINEDAYSYLYCVFYNYKYKYFGDLKVVYHLPANLPDHALQSTRFFQSMSRSYEEFGKKFVKNEYKLPIVLTIKTAITAMRKNQALVSYFAITFYMSIISRFIKPITNKWEISASSKKLYKSIRG